MITPALALVHVAVQRLAAVPALVEMPGERLRAALGGGEHDGLRDGLIAASRCNLSSQQQVHAAVLAAMDALDFEHFIHTVTRDWVDMLGLDAVVLAIESPATISPGVRDSLRLLEAGTIDAAMGHDCAVVLRGGLDNPSALFGPANPLVKAEALVRIDAGRVSPPALLALGSRDPATFAPGQGTELVRFLAAVVQRGLDRWLGEPQ